MRCACSVLQRRRRGSLGQLKEGVSDATATRTVHALWIVVLAPPVQLNIAVDARARVGRVGQRAVVEASHCELRGAKGIRIACTTFQDERIAK